MVDPRVRKTRDIYMLSVSSTLGHCKACFPIWENDDDDDVSNVKFQLYASLFYGFFKAYSCEDLGKRAEACLGQSKQPQTTSCKDLDK